MNEGVPTQVECQHGPACESCGCRHPYWDCPKCGEEYDDNGANEAGEWAEGQRGPISVRCTWMTTVKWKRARRGDDSEAPKASDRASGAYDNEHRQAGGHGR